MIQSAFGLAYSISDRLLYRVIDRHSCNQYNLEDEPTYRIEGTEDIYFGTLRVASEDAV